MVLGIPSIAHKKISLSSCIYVPVYNSSLHNAHEYELFTTGKEELLELNDFCLVFAVFLGSAVNQSTNFLMEEEEVYILGRRRVYQKGHRRRHHHQDHDEEHSQQQLECNEICIFYMSTSRRYRQTVSWVK